MKERLISFLTAAAIALGTGCTGSAYVTLEPPPLQVEVRSAPPRPTACWIDGYWKWKRNRYVWVPGHWERNCRGTWVPGYWERRGEFYFWVAGYWRR